LYDHEVHACFVSMCVKAKRASKPEVRQFVEAFETKLNEAHVEKAAAYNVSARAEGRETVEITDIQKEEEMAEGEDKPEIVEGEATDAAEEAREGNDDNAATTTVDEPVESKTLVVDDDQENVAPEEERLKVATPSPPRRSRRAAA